jgi:hypothetical protein
VNTGARVGRDRRRGPGRHQPDGARTIWGTIVGAFIIGVLNNCFNLMNVSPFYQLIAKGGVIVLAVLVDQAIKAGAGRSGPAAPSEDRGEQRAHSG